MNTSMQAAGARHLAPATPEAPFRVLIWERRSLLDIWVLAQVFEMATFEFDHQAARWDHDRDQRKHAS